MSIEDPRVDDYYYDDIKYDDHLYGCEDDEYLEADHDDALEKILDQIELGQTVKLCKYTSVAASSRMPDVGQVIEFIKEFTYENDLGFEEVAEQVDNACTDAVEGMVHQALHEWARGIGFRFSDRLVDSWEVQCIGDDDDMQILIDGTTTHVLVDNHWEEA